jgi:predicted ATPase
VAAALGQDIRAEDLQPALIAALKDKQMLHDIRQLRARCRFGCGTGGGDPEGCPRLNILATSREPLNVEENMFATAAARNATFHDTAHGERALAFPAVQLFVERASARLPEFELSDSDARSSLISAPSGWNSTCDRIRRSPRGFVRVRGMAARLDDRLRLLTMGRRTALPGTRPCGRPSTGATKFFPSRTPGLATLGIFMGRFTLEAASKL